MTVLFAVQTENEETDWSALYIGHGRGEKRFLLVIQRFRMMNLRFYIHEIVRRMNEDPNVITVFYLF